MMKMTSFLSAASRHPDDIEDGAAPADPEAPEVPRVTRDCSMMATTQLMTGRMWTVPTGPGAPAARRPLG